MPNITIRWRHIPGMGESKIAGLANLLPLACAEVLTIPGVREYAPHEVAVKVDVQTHMDVNLKPLRIEVNVQARPEQVARKVEVKNKIIQNVRSYLGDVAIGKAEVLLTLTESTHGEV